MAFVKGRASDEDEGAGDITHFQALMTALSGAVGTGNIAGVATAIAMGGPGALFWIWLMGFIGMATKYAEAVLAVKYRIKDSKGMMSGGPMYYIRHGMGEKWRWLAACFALFMSISVMGTGNMVQSNSVADVLQTVFHVPAVYTGIFLMIMVSLTVIGGIKSIARVASVLVPVMIVIYLISTTTILIIFIDRLPATLWLVVKHAFTPVAATGGFAGAGVILALRMGFARGVSSNESGMGSGPIAAAAAKTKDPVSQALVSMTQTFIDTVIVCTMTGLVLIITGEWSSGLDGAALTAHAFQTVLPGGNILISLSLIFFAFSTLITWCYYGEKTFSYLLGERVVLPYRIVFVMFVGIGAVAQLRLVWSIADILVGLMVIPNLIALFYLTPDVVKETRRFFAAQR